MNHSKMMLISHRFCNELISGSGPQTDQHALQRFVVSHTPGYLYYLVSSRAAEHMIRFVNIAFIGFAKLPKYTNCIRNFNTIC